VLIAGVEPVTLYPWCAAPGSARPWVRSPTIHPLFPVRGALTVF
jgi:hypothetical protein